ncbi:MAG: C39 family peptidase, partial [Parcubacteria group bacterium]
PANSNAGVDGVNATNVNVEPVPVLPASFNLEVPFTTQAPFANWDFPYQEACEEASTITVHYYYQDKTFTKEIADKEILDLVEWENDYFGDYKDTTAEETSEFIKAYWGYDHVDVEYDPTVEQIQRHVYAGRPVIVPAAGKQLGNPNFRNGGPLYHMFVVRGWADGQFITNDVGTRNGENYRYDYNVVMNAMHDWNGGDVNNGQKAIIIVYPND